MIQRSVFLLSLVLFLAVAHAGQSSSVMGLGAFSNFRFTEEHQYGVGVQLWREGESIFGLFLYSQGLMGDTPTGALEKVTFDPETGHLSFTARLTMGIHGCKLHNNVPSQDVFHFDGVLSEHSLSGTLVSTDNLHHELAPQSEDVVMEKSDEWIVGQYTSREQWATDMEKILKFRGPKW